MGRIQAAAIVLAGGSGSRVGGARNKVYLLLAGRSVIARSLDALGAPAAVGPVVLVVRDADRALAGELLAHELGGHHVEIVTGGATRQDSELAGLRQLAPRIEGGALDVVLVHDGARPLVGPALVEEVLRVAAATGGAVPGLPRDDLAAADPDGTLAGPAPAGLVAVQTPQGFRARPLLAAYEEAARTGFAGTDTASCVARFAPDLDVRWVRGEERNFKITYPHDLHVGEAVLASALRDEHLALQPVGVAEEQAVHGTEVVDGAVARPGRDEPLADGRERLV
jgi:2-C-methyl-D-erythritol 4-phosphate cytidylyltransferase